MFDIELLKHKNNICLIDENQILTYEEVNNLCKKLEESITDEKCLYLVLADKNIETIISYLSLLRKNQAFIMLDINLDKSILDNILNSYKPNYIIEKINNNTKYLFKFMNYGIKEYSNEKIIINKNLSLMLSTSGTTGSPKMVKLTKKNLYANCNSIIKYLNITQNDVAITNLPLHYSYGLSIINTHLAQGASIVVTNNSIFSREFWNIFKKHKVTSLNGVPYTYEMLKRIGFFKMDLPSLRYLTQAGGKLNINYIKEFATYAKEKNIDFFVMYGQTEATARISYLPPKDIFKKLGSIGIAIPGGKLYIKDTNEPFKEGELIYTGDNVMMGYAFSKEDLKKEDELHSVLHTGDVGYKDEDGYFYITGRLKRFIKIFGNRVNLDEIEQFLKSNDFNVACVGEDDKLLIATQNSDLEKIKNLITKKFKIHHNIINIKQIDTIPTTSSGKIDYNRLKKEFDDY